MGKTHFSGPVYSANGFVGAEDSNGNVTQVVANYFPAPTSINTAGNVTYTPAQILSGAILRDTNGAARTDTLPTAAALVAALTGPGVVAERTPLVGYAFECVFHNTAAAANALTINLGTGGTSAMTPSTYYVFGTTTIAQNAAPKTMIFRITNATVGSEAYSVIVY